MSIFTGIFPISHTICSPMLRYSENTPKLMGFWLVVSVRLFLFIIYIQIFIMENISGRSLALLVTGTFFVNKKYFLIHIKTGFHKYVVFIPLLLQISASSPEYEGMI